MNSSKTRRCVGIGALALMLALPGSSLLHANEAQPTLAPAGATDVAEYSWTGFYLGAHVGYGWGQGGRGDAVPVAGTGSFGIPVIPLSPAADGMLEGLQVGYNYQIYCLVLGIEDNFSITDMSGSKNISPVPQNSLIPVPSFMTSRMKTDWLDTLCLRAGITPVDRLLLYGKGGLAVGQVSYSADANFPLPLASYPASFSETKWGWIAGAGAEYAISQHWSVRLEYLFYDLGNESKTANALNPVAYSPLRYSWQTAAQTVNLGVNYKF